MFRFSLFLIFLITSLKTVSPTVVQFTSSNINDILASYELVFINFYADWCRFSQILAPIYEEAAAKVIEEFPTDNQVVFGKVDCDREAGIAVQYHVSKYPTLKMFRYGSSAKREYRGQRSTDAIANFIREQLKSPIASITNLDELGGLDWKKRHIIGYFDSEDSHDFKSVFRKVASILRDDCQFHSATGPVSENERVSGNKVTYRAPGDMREETTYSGSLSDYTSLLNWVTEICVPLVREITFENAEELTEEGLPFLILFHHPDDIDTPERFKKVVAEELMAEKLIVNFLTADGIKFTHPLQHLGKLANDLPVLAIDSFRHMYLWQQNPRDDIDKPNLLKQFIQDLQSGKLHREFHQGPDPTHPPALEHENAADDAGAAQAAGHVPKESDQDASTEDVRSPPAKADATSPPESLFRKLAPSRTRYTILRDEL